MVQIDPKRQQELIKDESLGNEICSELIKGLKPRNVLQWLIDEEIEGADKLTINEIRFVGWYWSAYIREEKRKKAAEMEKKRIKVEREARFETMKAAGKTFEQVAKETGESLTTVIKWGRAHEDDIQAFEAVRLETLQDRYPVFKSQRIALLGEQIVRIREELAKRDLHDMPTEKLFQALTHLAKLAKDEDPVVKITLNKKPLFR